ncbi:Adenylate/guanylate cyclase with integral membrane sensor OS=Tsukamurella paurometabola (strain ATCC 8368 / DSM / CCUG 35730 / CIP 100753 / JCM 10117 /KCTC 9821 / NBRC 16120 / NCIMB 702349 / NCTC 13040) OX=521096 GN=Tpau_0786 PE=3 SV=1 [Tsukamurella paurometabola]|uniref:Adenylate/guanylate cyclase with integral membrane sensor n=1 Tax=Tsukamurella paurometabola (strain ATCC 8368 / DSM 20162 / CCUG 35730 / CIP 100753 / JCM 10117 / KCTC 9821 / NBRC 16120 / NCIMB 702349 / NCTC 13040) TaxID=521096 RepID=D5UTR8_TSUPD|nr:adenylate/guanylate cyclase domain-containing protein [Tsukamurella paurometabola]ADG77422.1 adenylate/guanylate cyclase with integral membrane sensor [Tsukamurella paurometabola DSM 20162]SUP26979.1 Adenylate cyclase 2 [Tsukamurella paurometabola]
MKLPRLRADYGSILLGSTDESSRLTRLRVQLVITVGVIVANLIGVGLAIALAVVGIPEPPIPWDAWWMNFLVVPLYIGIAFVLGATIGTVRIVQSLRWSIRREEPTAAQAKAALTAPWRLTALQAVLWAGGTVIMTVGYGSIDPELIPKIALVTGLSGVVVCAISYQITEFALRPAAAQALEAGFRAPRRGRLRMRAATAWAIGSGVPILGIVLVAAFGTFRDDTTKLDIFVAVAALGAIALLTGPLLTLLNTDTLVAPLRVLGNAIRKVRDGETDVTVRIFDGSDMGELQAGFNAMTAGLAERERLRDLFGRHVGREVADAALGLGVQLGGSEQLVSVVFVDIVGSTTLARQKPATEVVELLNRFFEVIVTEVEANDGLVNKFEGDAVLAVFGAPLPHPDPAGGALRAARGIAARLPAAVPDLTAGIGVSHGTVVAGNVGAIERYEYTVIGDPVNESARLSEVAKRDTSLPVAAEAAIVAARESESQHWVFTDAVTLRGRDVPTRLYAPGSSTSTSSMNVVDPTVKGFSPASTNPDLA